MTGDMVIKGFGYVPEEEECYFVVELPAAQSGEDVKVFEVHSTIDDGEVLKATLPREKWELIAPAVKEEFNAELSQMHLPKGRLPASGKKANVSLARNLGKQLVMLLLGIQDAPADVIPTALANWRGLQPYERHWLYTRADDIYGNAEGWKAALRCILCENPTK